MSSTTIKKFNIKGLLRDDSANGKYNNVPTIQIDSTVTADQILNNDFLKQVGIEDPNAHTMTMPDASDLMDAYRDVNFKVGDIIKKTIHADASTNVLLVVAGSGGTLISQAAITTDGSTEIAGLSITVIFRWTDVGQVPTYDLYVNL